MLRPLLMIFIILWVAFGLTGTPETSIPDEIKDDLIFLYTDIDEAYKKYMEYNNMSNENRQKDIAKQLRVKQTQEELDDETKEKLMISTINILQFFLRRS